MSFSMMTKDGAVVTHIVASKRMEGKKNRRVSGAGEDGRRDKERQ